MKVDKVLSTNAINFNAGIKIKGADNKKHKYLYNEINKLTQEHKIPAAFGTHEIVLPTVTIEIMKELNKLKIRFNSGKKH